MEEEEETDASDDDKLDETEDNDNASQDASLTTAIRVTQEDNSLQSNVNSTEDDQEGKQCVEWYKKKKKRKRDQTRTKHQQLLSMKIVLSRQPVLMSQKVLKK
ncbi:Hypothetical predicted protein [Paramuricea clavata]|uniref:Uncharacterized protein n=1 Tax=Paramuricea clavata TaxID=317549 RepID=A0A6S7HE78_PARCT|nr:Hypothetical predicted protein [Paramuricea clavata]